MSAHSSASPAQIFTIQVSIGAKARVFAGAVLEKDKRAEGSPSHDII
jgi:hypothetical protein